MIFLIKFLKKNTYKWLLDVTWILKASIDLHEHIIYL